MAWKLTGPHHDETTIAALLADYPDLVAYDESGFEVDLADFDAAAAAAETLADAGYFNRSERRILFWTCEADSENDAGEKAVAEARWED